MSGKRISAVGVGLLVIGVLVGVAGNVFFGEQEGGGANVLHLIQLGCLALGVACLVVGAVAYLAGMRRTA